jgi:hypothetical protein
MTIKSSLFGEDLEEFAILRMNITIGRTVTPLVVHTPWCLFIFVLYDTSLWVLGERGIIVRRMMRKG